MHKYLIRYGVFAILLLMAAGVAVMLECLEIRTKSSVSLFLGADGASCAAYVSPSPHFAIAKGDTLTVEQAPGGTVNLVVEHIRREPAGTAMTLKNANGNRPLHETFGGNTYATGYLFTGKVKLRQLVAEKISR